MNLENWKNKKRKAFNLEIMSSLRVFSISLRGLEHKTFFSLQFGAFSFSLAEGGGGGGGGGGGRGIAEGADGAEEGVGGSEASSEEETFSEERGLDEEEGEEAWTGGGIEVVPEEGGEKEEEIPFGSLGILPFLRFRFSTEISFSSSILSCTSRIWFSKWANRSLNWCSNTPTLKIVRVKKRIIKSEKVKW
jgi:hypothetical protein